MTLLHALSRNGLGRRTPDLATSIMTSSCHTTRFGLTVRQTNPRSPLQPTLFIKRWKQSSSRVPPPPATTARQQQRHVPAYKYPSIINIYRPGATATIFQGTNRIIAFFLFTAGIFWTSHIYFLPSTSSDPAITDPPEAISNKALWMVALPILSVIPLIMTVFVSGSYVHSIRLHLPTSARRERDALLRFASHPSPDTQIEIAYMAFRPWPKWRSMYYEDLRRVKGRMSVNLVHLPIKEYETVAEMPLAARLFARQQGQYYVKGNGSAVGKGKSNFGAVPGVWDRLFESMPYEGQGRKAR